MPIHDILVHLDRTPHSDSRLELAAALAARHGAGLIGLRVENHPHIPEAFRGGIRPAALEAQAKAIADDTARIEATFRSAASRHGLPAEWWLETSGGVDAVCRRARYAGLTVVGQPAHDREEELPGTDVLLQLLMTSGRPVLVVPETPQPVLPGAKVAVAWNGSREATRALADSLPLLSKADTVTVLEVRHNEREDGFDGLSEACRHLTRNGVDAHFKIIQTSDHDVGTRLHTEAVSLGCDLLVTGAYGHSRMFEIVLGGATRWLLDHAAIPVLMSH